MDFKKENNAIIIDYLPRGYLNSSMTKATGKPIAQAIGKDYFTLFELAPKNGKNLEIGETVYIGKGKRDKIYRVLGKLDSDNLTEMSKLELDDAIEEIVGNNEEKYVEFFNNAKSISWDLHELGLLPGIGAKSVSVILNERERKKFTSFNDISNRVKAVKNPKESVVKRVKEELGLIKSRRKHQFYVFTQPPKGKI